MQMNTYNLTASRYGGEHTKGIITQEQGHFWTEMGNELFTQYLHFQDDLNEKWNIPEHHQLNEFYEIDDIDHTYAPEFEASNYIEVSKFGDPNQDVIAEIDFATDESKSLVLVKDNEEYTGDDVVVYSQSWEKGGFQNTIEIDGELEVSKLKFLCSTTYGIMLIDNIHYDDGTEDGIDGDGWQGDTLGKNWNSWIDADTLKMHHQEWCDANPELMKLITNIKTKDASDTHHADT